jgi:hypothetical protein
MSGPPPPLPTGRQAPLPPWRLCHSSLFVIASDRRERGNPTKSLRGRSPWQSQEFPRFARDKASVVSPPRNDITTQSLKGEGKGEGGFNLGEL